MPLYVGVELGQEENFGAAAAVAVALGEEILFDRSGLMGYEAGLADGGGGEAAHGIEHGTGAKELVGTGVGLALDIAECKRAGVLQLVGGVVCEVAQDDVRELVCQRPAQAGDRRVYVVDEHDILVKPGAVEGAALSGSKTLGNVAQGDVIVTGHLSVGVDLAADILQRGIRIEGEPVNGELHQKFVGGLMGIVEPWH